MGPAPAGCLVRYITVAPPVLIIKGLKISTMQGGTLQWRPVSRVMA
jgi:hypothetical protein